MIQLQAMMSNQSSSRGGMEMTSGDFTITGVNSTDYVSDFTSGTSEITDGVVLRLILRIILQ